MNRFCIFTFILFSNIIYSVIYKVKIVAEKKNAFFNELKEFRNQRILNNGYILSAIPDEGVICFEFLKNLNIEKVIKKYGNLSGEWLQKEDGIFGGKVLVPSTSKIVYKEKNIESDEYKLSEKFKQHLKFLKSLNGRIIFKINKEIVKKMISQEYQNTFIITDVGNNNIEVELKDINDYNVEYICDKMYKFSFFIPEGYALLDIYADMHKKRNFEDVDYYYKIKFKELKDKISTEVCKMFEGIEIIKPLNGYDIKIYKSKGDEIKHGTLEEGVYYYTIGAIIIDEETNEQIKNIKKTTEEYNKKYEEILHLSESKNNNDIKNFITKGEEIINAITNIEYPECETEISIKLINEFKKKLDIISRAIRKKIDNIKVTLNKINPTSKTVKVQSELKSIHETESELKPIHETKSELEPIFKPEIQFKQIHESESQFKPITENKKPNQTIYETKEENNKNGFTNGKCLSCRCSKN